VTEEQTRIEEEPIEGFAREVEDAGATDDEPAVEVIEGEIVEEETEALDEEKEEIDELEALRQQFEEAQAQADEYLDDLRRERAAFQNYKKRQENERAELRQASLAGVLIQILPVVDDLERALEAIPEDQADQPWVGGVTLIQRKLLTTLEGFGIVPVEAEPGQPFDPFVHEAVSYEEHKDHQEGQIIAVVQNGYTLGQRTLRPAMVRVAK
jgi:molecular chaperone GrpE